MIMWSSFRKIQGPVGTVGTVVLGVLLWRFSRDGSIRLAVALPVGVLFMILLLTLCDAVYQMYKMSQRVLPRVLFGRKAAGQMEGEKVLCLLEPSELFSHGALVSFYHVGHENFEELIGIGTVVNVQEDRKIQVAMTWCVDGHEGTAERLARNDKEVLEKIMVKPSVPSAYQASTWDAPWARIVKEDANE